MKKKILPLTNLVYSIGYNGYGNIGDDLMFYYSFYNSDFKVICNSRDYKIIDEIHISNINYYLQIPFTKNDVIFFGGNIFVFSSLWSYFKIIYWIILVSSRSYLKRNTYLKSFGLNIGEYSKFQLFLIEIILKKLDKIECRDLSSYNFILNKNFANVTFNHDIVLHQNLLKKTINKRIQNNTVYFFISSQNIKSEIYISHLFKCLEKRYSVKVLCQGIGDLLFFNRLVQINPSFSIFSVEIYNYSNLSNILNEINNSKFILTMRYHGGVIGESLKLDWVPCNSSAKLVNISSTKYMLNEIP